VGGWVLYFQPYPHQCSPHLHCKCPRDPLAKLSKKHLALGTAAQWKNVPAQYWQCPELWPDIAEAALRMDWKAKAIVDYLKSTAAGKIKYCQLNWGTVHCMSDLDLSFLGIFLMTHIMRFRFRHLLSWEALLTAPDLTFQMGGGWSLGVSLFWYPPCCLRAVLLTSEGSLWPWSSCHSSKKPPDSKIYLLEAK